MSRVNYIVELSLLLLIIACIIYLYYAYEKLSWLNYCILYQIQFITKLAWVLYAITFTKSFDLPLLFYVFPLHYEIIVQFS